MHELFFIKSKHDLESFFIVENLRIKFKICITYSLAFTIYVEHNRTLTFEGFSSYTVFLKMFRSRSRTLTFRSRKSESKK